MILLCVHATQSPIRIHTSILDTSQIGFLSQRFCTAKPYPYASTESNNSWTRVIVLVSSTPVSGTELRPMTRAHLIIMIKTHPCFHPMPCRTRARTIEIKFISSGSCRGTSCQYPPGTSGNYIRQGFKNFIRTFRFVCLEGKVGKTKKAFALTTYTIVLIFFLKKYQKGHHDSWEEEALKRHHNMWYHTQMLLYASVESTWYCNTVTVSVVVIYYR